MQVLIIRDRSTGRIHKRFRATDDGPLASYEGCNADDGGKFDELFDVPEEGDFCKRCFPEEQQL